MMWTRRDFITRSTFAVIPVAALSRARQEPIPKTQGPRSAGVAADTLINPSGPPAAALGPLDNDPGVIAIERKIRCSCGCTLDVYTCRTTDFSCTFSPAMHRDVVGLVQKGRSAEEILAWFVAQPDYGEKILMAPPAKGLNLMGYLIPGLTFTAVGLALAAWLVHHRSARNEVVIASAAPIPVPTKQPEGDQLERLRRALEDVDS